MATPRKSSDDGKPRKGDGNSMTAAELDAMIAEQAATMPGKAMFRDGEGYVTQRRSAGRAGSAVLRGGGRWRQGKPRGE